MFPRFGPGSVGGEEIDDGPILHNPYFTIRRARTPKTARIRIFASMTSTSAFACSRSATGILKIVDQFVFADSGRGDQCV